MSMLNDEVDVNSQVETVAERLTRATRAGELAGAYAVLARLPTDLVREVAMRAGYQVLAGSKISRDAWRACWASLQAQIAAACERRTDGFGLFR